jgi:hypothetical protein
MTESSWTIRRVPDAELVSFATDMGRWMREQADAYVDKDLPPEIALQWDQDAADLQEIVAEIDRRNTFASS